MCHHRDAQTLPGRGPLPECPVSAGVTTNTEIEDPLVIVCQASVRVIEESISTAVVPAALGRDRASSWRHSRQADLQGELPLAAALKGGDESGVGDDVGRAALLLHEIEQVPRLLPLPACAPQDSFLSALIRSFTRPHTVLQTHVNPNSLLGQL